MTRYSDRKMGTWIAVKECKECGEADHKGKGKKKKKRGCGLGAGGGDCAALSTKCAERRTDVPVVIFLKRGNFIQHRLSALNSTGDFCGF